MTLGSFDHPIGLLAPPRPGASREWHPPGKGLYMGSPYRPARPGYRGRGWWRSTPPYPPILPPMKWLRRGFFPTSEPQGRAAEGLTRLPSPSPVISHLYRCRGVAKCRRGSLNAHFTPRGCVLVVASVSGTGKDSPSPYPLGSRTLHLSRTGPCHTLWAHE